jgi:hypothetical protein
MLLKKDKKQHLGHSVPKIKQKEGESAIVCSREPKAGAILASVRTTKLRILWWPAAAPVIAVTAARSSRDQRQGVRYVTGSHLLRLVFSCNTESNLRHTKMCTGHGVKY